MADVEMQVGERLIVVSRLANIGDQPATQDIDLTVDGTSVDVEEVSLDARGGAGARTGYVADWVTDGDDIGTHTVTLQSDDDSDSIEVDVVQQDGFVHYADFETATVGATPDGWSGGVVVESGFSQFQSLHLDNDTETIWSGGPDVDNQTGEFHGLVTFDQAGTANIRLAPSLSNFDDETLLRFVPRDGPDSEVDLISTNESASTESIDDVSIPEYLADSWWRYKIQMSSSTTTATVWKAGVANPTMYNLSVDAPGHDTNQSALARTSGNGQLYIDWIGIKADSS